jgi:SAM-dependent methyltransferase
MTLTELNAEKLVNNDHHAEWTSDKETDHSYLSGYYEHEFKDNTRNVNLLEIGVAQGDSLRLWSEWFTEGKITGIELNNALPRPLLNHSRVDLIIADGFSDETINRFEDNSFDYIIDDGPHTLTSMVISVQKWINKVKPGGKLIIEDVQEFLWIEVVESYVDKLKVESYKVFDLRENKGRYDDIIIEIEKK